MRYGFIIDQDSCIGCHACTVACKTEHQVPLAICCRAGRRRLRHESKPWWTTSVGTLLFRAVDKSGKTIKSSSVYAVFGHLSVEVRHPNVLPSSASAPAARLAGPHMNPELAASHPPCLSPGRNLVGVIKVSDHVVAAQRIEK